jgi:uncharacterized protein (TIGR03067 family)
MYGGKPVKDAVGEFIVFTGMSYIEEDANGRETSRGSITIDETVEPATIDALSDKNYLNRGVYALRGDSLEICWGYKNRPASLDSSKQKTFFYIMLVRVPQ